MGPRLRSRAFTFLGSGAMCLLALAATCPPDNPVSFVVEVHAVGTGAGTVRITSGRITCDVNAATAQGVCSERYVNFAGHLFYTATPASGSVFVAWVNAGDGTNSCADAAASICDVLWAEGSPDTVIVQPHFAVVGVEESELAVEVTSNDGEFRKVVTAGDGQINCRDLAEATDRCTAWYAVGATVTLHAENLRPIGAPVLGWSQCAPDPAGAENCSVLMTEGRHVVAHFDRRYTLSMMAAGNGAGTVTSSPAGINCTSNAGVRSGVCFSAFPGVTTTGGLGLTATPAAGSTFAGFEGSFRGVPFVCPALCGVTVFDGMTVTATFSLGTAPTYALDVSFTGAGQGTITSSPAGINCANFSGGGSTSCSASYTSGTAVTLTATPNGTSIFTGWSGGSCTGTATCVVVVDQARSVIATFASPTFLLTIRQAFSLTGTGTGFVTSAPSGISCTFTTGQTAPGGTCATVFPSGTIVTLTAGVAPPSTFASWLAAPGCASNPVCQVTMDQARTVDVLINP